MYISIYILVLMRKEVLFLFCSHFDLSFRFKVSSLALITNKQTYTPLFCFTHLCIIIICWNSPTLWSPITLSIHSFILFSLCFLIHFLIHSIIHSFYSMYIQSFILLHTLTCCCCCWCCWCVAYWFSCLLLGAVYLKYSAIAPNSCHLPGWYLLPSIAFLQQFLAFPTLLSACFFWFIVCTEQ